MISGDFKDNLGMLTYQWSVKGKGQCDFSCINEIKVDSYILAR